VLALRGADNGRIFPTSGDCTRPLSLTLLFEARDWRLKYGPSRWQRQLVIPDLLDPFRHLDGAVVRGDVSNEQHLDDATEREVEAFWSLLARSSKREDSSDERD